MELPHVSYMSPLGFISQTKKNLFDVLYLDEGRLWVWVYFTSAGGFMWLNSRFYVFSSQWCCTAAAAGEPAVPQSADQPDAGGCRRTNQKYSGEFTCFKLSQGSFWCQVGRHSKVQTGPAEWFLVVVGFLTFLQNWIPHSFFCFLASNNFRDSFM